MTEAEKLIQDLTYVIRSLQNNPAEWDANGLMKDAKESVSDLFTMAEAVEDGFEE